MTSASTEDLPDVGVCLGDEYDSYLSAGSEIFYISDLLDEFGRPNLVVTRNCEGASEFHFQYSDGISFSVNKSGSRVWGAWPKSMTLEDAVVYLLGPILGLVLRLRETAVLHAACVVVDGKAIAVVGAQGAGKSTLAARFALDKFPILSDDLLALKQEGGTFWALPGYPRVRLWPESVQQLFDRDLQLPYLTPNWDKRYLDLTGEGLKFECEPVKLERIYFLHNNPQQSTTRIETMVSAKGLLELLTHGYGNYLLERSMQMREFDLFSRIAQQATLCKVNRSGMSPYELCQLIVEDCRRFTSEDDVFRPDHV